MFEDLKVDTKEDVKVPKVKNTFDNEVPATTKKKMDEKLVEPKGNQGIGAGKFRF